MQTPSLNLFATILLATALMTGAAVAADTPAPAVKWRIAANGTAATDSELQFRVTPETGEPILVTARIANGQGSLTIAKNVCEAFKTQLPKRVYRCEVMHGAEALVKAGHEQPAFALELVTSTMTGARVQVSAD